MTHSRKWFVLAGLALLPAALYLAYRSRVGDTASTSPEQSPILSHPAQPTLGEDPAPSFDLTRHTADTGGDERSRQLAIKWLDTRAREGQALGEDQASWLLDTLHAGGHPDWEPGCRQWFYNSAFNALHQSEDPQPLTRLLARLAEKDTDPTIRLYALQHIGNQRADGRLTGPAASDTHRLESLLARDPATAGTVIELLAGWDGEGAPKDPATRQRAAAMAEDRTLAVDVRITAIHAAGPEALPAARRLSTAANQPVLLRKAAIACIGRHGSESDFSDLEKLSAESTRLAQSADPARLAIQQRISRAAAPATIPF